MQSTSKKWQRKQKGMAEHKMEKLIDKLKNNDRMTVKELRELFRMRHHWQEDLCRLLAKKALDMGENFYAYDFAEKINSSGKEPDLQKLHIMTLALARSGSLDRAAELLKRIPESDDSEIVGLKSRILKDMALNTSAGEKRQGLFRRSAEMSLEVFMHHKRYYNGINAASCFFMAGQRDFAQQLVREQVLPCCMQEVQHDYWWHATLGECYLLLNDFSLAAGHYKKAAGIAVGQGELGSLASTLRQFCMLATCFDASRIEEVRAQIQLPGVAIFSGHMIDRPERKEPRFPAYAEEQVRRELEKVIRQNNIRIAYVSCACGGDILFMEEVLKAGGECVILPPLPLQETIRNSVDIIPGANWKERLETILQNGNVLLLDAECDEIGEEDDAIIYDFTNRYLFGMAQHKAATLNLPICGVTVWNRKKSGLIGGTDSAVALWEAKNIAIHIITPEINK